MNKSKIIEITQKMQPYLNEKQLNQLYEVLSISLHNCEIFEKDTPLKSNEVLYSYNDWIKLLDEYLTSKSLEGKSKNTINRYKYELTRLLSYINKNVTDITNNDISDFLIEYKTIRKVSNQTLKNVRAVYSSFFVWLRDRNKIQVNPMLLVENIKVERKIKKPFSDVEREMLFRNCKTIRDKAILEVLYSTAIRVSELISLNKNDVRFETKHMIVYGKGGKERVVYLNEKARLYLLEYINNRQDENEALFVSNKKPYNRMSKTGVENIIRKLGNSVGIHAYPHKFRRTATTNAINRGMPVQEVSKFLGHSKLETTMMYCVTDQQSVQFHHQKYLNS